MKLHELARQVQALGLGTGSNATKEQQRAVLERLNIDWDSFYQEVEMDYPLVQTQQDVSEQAMWWRCTAMPTTRSFLSAAEICSI